MYQKDQRIMHSLQHRFTLVVTGSIWKKKKKEANCSPMEYEFELSILILQTEDR